MYVGTWYASFKEMCWTVSDDFKVQVNDFKRETKFNIKFLDVTWLENKFQPQDYYNGYIGLAPKDSLVGSPSFLDQLKQAGKIDHHIFSFYIDSNDATPFDRRANSSHIQFGNWNKKGMADNVDL